MSFISSLSLHNFRCYKQAALADVTPGLVVLFGPNGAGKTNVLEAISLLAPGRGLRSAKNIEMQSQHSPRAWAVSAEINRGAAMPVRIGTGLDPATDKRMIRIQGETVKSQSALADYLACVWLTPQMDRLFIDSASHRRRFLDRLVFAFDPGHAGRVSRYDQALSQRSRLLRDGNPDLVWLTGLEKQIAETGIAIAAARLDFVQRLQAVCSTRPDDHFPRARLAVTGTIEGLLSKAPALEVEDMFLYQLVASRPRDSQTGGAATGPHKSDLAVIFDSKNMPADQCSTGEQKALLIGIILAHAYLIKAERGLIPILLLDEIAAHLDEQRRGALYDILQAAGGQVWLTGTDHNLFEAVKNSAQFFEVQGASIAAHDDPVISQMRVTGR